MLIVIAYAAVMRGAPALRGFLLAHCVCAVAVRDRDDAVAVDHVAGASPSSCSGSPPRSSRWRPPPAPGSSSRCSAGTGAIAGLRVARRRQRARSWIVVGSTTRRGGRRRALAAAGSGTRTPGRGPGSRCSTPWSLSLPGFVALGHAALTSAAVRRAPPAARRAGREPRHLRRPRRRRRSRTASAAFPLGWLLSGDRQPARRARARRRGSAARARGRHRRAAARACYFAAGALLGVGRARRARRAAAVVAARRWSLVAVLRSACA